jgi:hypothetical protein
MLLLGVSVSVLVLLSCVAVLVVARRRASRRLPAGISTGAQPQEAQNGLLEAEQVLTHQLFVGGILRAEYRQAMADLARQDSGTPA